MVTTQSLHRLAATMNKSWFHGDLSSSDAYAILVIGLLFCFGRVCMCVSVCSEDSNNKHLTFNYFFHQRDKKPGSFLVRFSTTQPKFVISSVVAKTNKVARACVYVRVNVVSTDFLT